MLKRITFLFLAVLAISFVTKAQTNFSDDFEAGTMSVGWVAGSGQYAISQSEGVLHISVSKYEGWKSFSMNLPSTVNLTANPYVNVKVKTGQDITLDIYLVDETNASKNITKRISRTDGFNRISWDFTGVTGINLAKITKLYFAVNGTALSYNGNL